jgi:hypothetical protein
MMDSPELRNLFETYETVKEILDSSDKAALWFGVKNPHLGDQLGVQLSDQLGVQLWSELNYQLRSQLRSQLWSQLSSELITSIKEELNREA